MSNKHDIRSGIQYEMLFAISLIEKARYLSECSQQLNYSILKRMLPVLKGNCNTLESLVFNELEIDRFYLDLRFVLKCSLYSHKKVIRAIESSYDDRTVYEAICRENEACILDKLCSILKYGKLNLYKNYHKCRSWCLKFILIMFFQTS